MIHIYNLPFNPKNNPIFSLDDREIVLISEFCKSKNIIIDEYGDTVIGLSIIHAILTFLGEKIKAKEEKYIYDKEYHWYKSLRDKFIMIDNYDAVLFVGD